MFNDLRSCNQTPLPLATPTFNPKPGDRQSSGDACHSRKFEAAGSEILGYGGQFWGHQWVHDCFGLFQPPKKIFYYIMVGVLVNKLGKVMVQLCSMGLGTMPWKVPQPWCFQLDDAVLKLTRAAESFQRIFEDPCLDCQLPPKGSSSGKVLAHACRTIDNVIDRYGPLVFKIGWTHCPFYRFRGCKYGYASDIHQRWEKLLVLYSSVEPVGPSFLESALIQRYRGISVSAMPFLF